jgi:hypothetical protein
LTSSPSSASPLMSVPWLSLLHFHGALV